MSKICFQNFFVVTEKRANISFLIDGVNHKSISLLVSRMYVGPFVYHISNFQNGG